MINDEYFNIIINYTRRTDEQCSYPTHSFIINIRKTSMPFYAVRCEKKQRKLLGCKRNS